MRESQLFHLQSLHPRRHVVFCLSLSGVKLKVDGHFVWEGGREGKKDSSTKGFQQKPPALEFHGRHKDRDIMVPEKEFLPQRMACFKRLL